MPPSTTGLDTAALCQRVMSRRDWRLLSFAEMHTGLDAFVAAVDATAREWSEQKGSAVDETLLERAVVHEYCILLHTALCLPRTPAQERALVETWNYITPIIRQDVGDNQRADDCALEALESIWEHADTVQKPGSFLSWAAMIATRIVWAEEHRAGRTVFPDDAEEDDDADEGGMDRAARDAKEAHIKQPMMGQSSLRGEEALTEVERQVDLLPLLKAIRKCLGSQRNYDVFIDLALGYRTVRDVAASLGITANHVYQIYYRARQAIERCRDSLSALASRLE